MTTLSGLRRRTAEANRAATSTHRILLVAPRPRRPVTGEAIEPDTSKPITTGPASSGTLPQAVSAAACKAALIFCGTSSLARRRQELVGKLPRAADFFRIGQPAGHVVDHFLVGVRTDHPVASERVKVHPQGLGAHFCGRSPPRPPAPWPRRPRGPSGRGDWRQAGAGLRPTRPRGRRPACGLPPAGRHRQPAPTSTGLPASQPNRARRALSGGVGRARRSTSRRLRSLPIEADRSFSTEAVFSHR